MYFKSGVVILLILLSSTLAYTQSSRADSAITLLEKSNTQKGIDSLQFIAALEFISAIDLTDADIIRLEKAADLLKNGNDERPCFTVKYMILRSLYRTDKLKSIQYGKDQIAALERSRISQARGLRLQFLSYLRVPYRETDQLAEGFKYYAEKLNEMKKMNDSTGISVCYYVLGGFYRSIGLFEPALYNMKKSVSYIDTIHNSVFSNYQITSDYGISRWINNAGLLSGFYMEMGDLDQAENYGRLVLKVAMNYNQSEKYKHKESAVNATYTARHLVEAKLAKGELDSIEYYMEITGRSLKGDRARADRSLIPYYQQLYARYFIQKGDFSKADSLLKECWDWVNRYKVGVNQPGGIIHPDYYLAQIEIKKGNYIEAIRLLKQDMERVRLIRPLVLMDYKELAMVYEKAGQDLLAKTAYKDFISLQDSLLADQSTFRTISFETEQQITENEIAISELESANKLSAQFRNFTIGIAFLLVVLAGSIYYRFRAKKKANQVLESTLTELKATQSQLIQSEKMASLGELTAGIAHEIQNPLNFVNNFSELNTELITELEEEANKGNTAEVKSIAADIRENSEKINHHGKRADAIVKGMLQHSSSGTGKKELTDINALADEYLRLAYHGLRAKDKSFNATMKTEFDGSIGKVSIVPQDIGRVVLNLITNAFYAVTEKKRQAADGFEPTVTVITRKSSDRVEITVSDNGTGIPPSIVDKIFQPFFTTKPTGKGTGLGLSLSYDMVKAHGGEISVDTFEAEGTTFTISLPVTTRNS